jgi:predicted component of type VI protein secretion system
MPRIEVRRTGISPFVRPVPTDTTLLILPMTPARVGAEVQDEEEQPVRIDSVTDAFAHFRPTLRFVTTAGEAATEFVAELAFQSLKDFTPEHIHKKVPGQRNDLADVHQFITLLYRLKERWSLPAVKRAWNDPQLRQQLLAMLAHLHTEMAGIARAAQEEA